MGIAYKESKRTIALQYGVLIAGMVLMTQLSVAQLTLTDMASRAKENIATVIGMSVGVPPNEVNVFAQALQNKEIELSERERALDLREREIRAVVLEETAKGNRITLYVIFAITSLLVALIAINFYLDMVRRKPEETLASREHSDRNLDGVHAHEGEFTTKL